MDSKSNLVLYLIGFVIVIGGLAWGASLAGVPPTWIGVGVVVLIGIAILSAIKHTQGKAVPHDGSERTTVVRRDAE